MGDDKDNQEGIGFSGISSLLPDDSPDAATQQPATAAKPESSQSAAVSPASAATGPTPPKQPASTSQPTQPAPRPRSGAGAVWAWIGGAAVVVFLIWAANQSGTQPSGQPAYQPPVAQSDSSTQPSNSSQDDKANATVANDASQPDVRELQTPPMGSSGKVDFSQFGTPVEPLLKMPPIGSDNVLSVAEIRYCLALKQRVEGAQPGVDTYNHGQVERFNAMVDDYNGRCHEFRYYTGDLQQAERDVAPYSRQYQAEGRRRVQGDAPSPSTAQQPTASAVTRTMIGNAQRALNALGYDVGTPDGIMGPKTHAAIMTFQRTAGLVSDGQMSDQLLTSLNSATRHNAGVSNEVGSGEQPTAASAVSIDQLTYDEKGAIETACVMARTQGVSSYNSCLANQLQQLANGPREPSLDGLTYDEKSAIQTACVMARTSGAASYNRCLAKQLTQLANGPREPSLEGLTYDEKSAIQTACVMARTSGAASYNRCLTGQLGQLANGPREPSLDGLTYDEKSAIQTACVMARTSGAASYNRCLTKQLDQLANGPREPSLAGLTYEEKNAIQTACVMARTSGAASYNRCLVSQLRALGR